MTDFELFIEANGLRKKDLADYIGSSPQYITQLCNGTRRLSQDKIALLKQNTMGWDTSMLTSDRPSITASAAGNARVEIGSRNKNFCPGETDAASRIAVLEKEIEMLKERLKDKDGQIEFLRTLIK